MIREKRGSLKMLKLLESEVRVEFGRCNMLSASKLGDVGEGFTVKMLRVSLCCFY